MTKITRVKMDFNLKKNYINKRKFLSNYKSIIHMIITRLYDVLTSARIVQTFDP